MSFRAAVAVVAHMTASPSIKPRSVSTPFTLPFSIATLVASADVRKLSSYLSCIRSAIHPKPFLMVSNPDYLPMLTKDPLGRQLIAIAFTAICIGIIWIRRIIRIDV